MLTRHGLTAVIAAVGAFAIGRAFGLLELFVLGAGLTMAIVFSVVSVSRQLPPLEVRRIVRPTLVAVGEPARVDIRVVNAGHKPTPHLLLWEPVGTNGGAPMQLATLAPNEHAQAAYRVPTNERGLLTTGPLRAQRRDVLGLCRRATLLAGTDDVIIVPQHVVLPFPAAGSAGRLGQHLRMKAWGQTGGEFHSLREYVPGDDLRRINWKASARSEELVVRETALEGVRRCTVVLDTADEAYDAAAFERAVSAAASVTLSAAGRGVATRLVAPGIDVRGPEVAITALRWLATVQRSATTLEQVSLAGTAGDGIGLVVLVTTSLAAPSTAVVRAGCGPDETLVVVVASIVTGGHGFDVDGTSLSALVESWSALVAGRQPVGVGR